MPFRYEEFDLSGVRTYPLASRPRTAKAEDFALPVARGGSFKNWFDSLPSILGAADVRRVVEALVAAKKRDAGIVWGIGAHVITTGVPPVLIRAVERGHVRGGRRGARSRPVRDGGRNGHGAECSHCRGARGAKGPRRGRRGIP